MRFVKYGGLEFPINANVLTGFFYRQQFGRDFLSDLLEMVTKTNTLVVPKIVWSLAKSYDFDLIDYDQWLLKLKEGPADYEGILLETNKFLRKVDIDSNQSENTDHYEVKLLATAAKLGFELDALKLLLPSDLINATSQPQLRKATSEEFQNFFG